MEITEAKLYEAFGIAQTEQGAQEQEPAEPAQDPNAESSENGEKQSSQGTVDTDDGDGEDAEPDADSEEHQTEDNEGQNDTSTDKANTKPLTQQERRANAARRRAQEQQAATQRAVEEAIRAERQQQTKLLEETLMQAGLKNTATGETIKTLEELQNWAREMADSRLQKDLKSGKLTMEALNQLIEVHPAVQGAMHALQQAQAQQDAQRSQAEQARIDEQFKKIAKLNPDIKGLSDILAMETAPAFRENVAKGMDFYDSYRLANMDAIADARAQRAVQAAGQNARGKEHLRATGNSRGSGAASVPQTELKLYRMMNPGMTDAQIQAHYNKYLKQGGK